MTTSTFRRRSIGAACLPPLGSRHRRRLLVGAICAVLPVASFFASASAQARTSSVTCGVVITTDTKLRSNLLNCPNNGIVIGADNVTLNLNGYRVGGDGTPVALCPDGTSCDVGIDNSAGHTGVTIMNGSIHGFDVGIRVFQASENRIQNVLSVNNASFGVVVGDSTYSRIENNISKSDGISGILMFGASNVNIERNSVTGTSGYAMPIFGSNHIRVTDNVLNGDQHGILLDTSNDNEVNGNRIPTADQSRSATATGTESSGTSSLTLPTV